MNDYIGIGILIALIYIGHQLSKVFGKNQEIKFALSKLLEHHGIELGKRVEPSDKVKELAKTKGAEIEAIKAYRVQSGLGLKEAKAAVESLRSAPAGDA